MDFQTLGHGEGRNSPLEADYRPGRALSRDRLRRGMAACRGRGRGTPCVNTSLFSFWVCKRNDTTYVVSFLLPSMQSFIYAIPVDNMEPGINIICPQILVLQVISVLPNIQGKNGRQPLRQRIILVRQGNDMKVPRGISHQPRKSRTKLSQRRSLHLFLPSFLPTEMLCNRG